jgi:N-acetylglucosaminyl-diphospho-decaprenol L-rhamnosyltransferase
MAEAPLGVVIVTYNSRREIDTCLEALFSELGSRPAHVIVVDNASTDGTAEWIATRWPQVALRAQRENRGFAAANNAGLRELADEMILLLNPDAVVQPGALSALLVGMEQHPEAGVVGPRLISPDGTWQPSCREFPGLFGDFVGMSELYRWPWARRLLSRGLISLSERIEPRAVDWVSGACFLVRRAAFVDAGPLDESFFMYSEEMEWQYRMTQHGWHAWFEPAAEVVHIGGASTSAVPGRRIVWQYQGIYRFYRLHRSPAQRMALRGLVWAVTWPKILFLTVAGMGLARRRELRRAFWQVLWL